MGNTFVYRDDNHVSAAYAEAVAPVLGDRISGLLAPGIVNSRPGDG
ncbi:hypothetical protein OIE51_11160 [Streptomyces sp. NBC_01803]|nr:hypothetical protein [Streptomyces sp. NBC_01803]WSA44714.1 hypothetical protein OIE51_11160 [Streptomyces sp. NBC_01803]